MKTLNSNQTVKLVSLFTLSLIVFGTTLFAQPNFLSEDYSEEELKIEEWMTNINSFEALTTDEYYEEPLEIQAWMLNSNELVPALDENFTEDQLAIEDWMMDYNTFSGEVEEPLLAIEDWMLSYKTFTCKQFDVENLVAEVNEEPMEIQAWMTDYDVFNTETPSFIPSINTIDLDNPKPVLIALHTVK